MREETMTSPPDAEFVIIVANFLRDCNTDCAALHYFVRDGQADLQSKKIMVQ
jgi:hypothetical protein